MLLLSVHVPHQNVSSCHKAFSILLFCPMSAAFVYIHSILYIFTYLEYNIS
jgi:hypothetical protein